MGGCRQGRFQAWRRRDSGNTRSKGNKDSRLAAYENIELFDTCILVGKPNIIEMYDPSVIVIPGYAIEELDQLKTNNRCAIAARNARIVLHKLHGYKLKYGSLAKGVRIASGSLLFTDHHSGDFRRLPMGLVRKNDSRIILAALAWQKKYPRHKVTIITKDASLDLTADAYGINTKDYGRDWPLEKLQTV